MRPVARLGVGRGRRRRCGRRRDRTRMDQRGPSSSPASRSRIIGLRERRDDAIEVAAELCDHPDPAQRASFAEVAFPSGLEVGFAVIGHLDRGHRLLKVLAHLDVLLEDMIPRHVVHLDEMALGVANLSDDIVLGYSPKAKHDLGRTSARGCHVAPRRAPAASAYAAIAPRDRLRSIRMCGMAYTRPRIVRRPVWRRSGAPQTDRRLPEIRTRKPTLTVRPDCLREPRTAANTGEKPRKR